MRKPPSFWFHEHANWAAKFLSPLSWVWQKALSRRLSAGSWEHVNVPIICVGNINMGGTGKTPTVIDIVTRLQDMKRMPHIVSRGYGGAMKGPALVSIASHNADDVGDEPILLAAFAPTWVARDRQAGAHAAIKAGADVIVLDDGFQNPSLHKTLSIIVVDAGVGFGNGRVFPSGPLREPIQSGLARADMILSIGPAADQINFSANWHQVAQHTHIKATLTPLHTGMNWVGLKVLAFAGIGRPQKFFDTLETLGADIVQTRAFGDHQRLPLAMLQRLEAEAEAMGAQLVTTEKDAARLPVSYQQKVLTLPVRLDIENPDALDAALAAL